MKNKKSAFRQVFIEGKGSSRPQHLNFNYAWYKILWMVCPATVVSVFISSIYHGGDIICLWQGFFIPPLFRLHELWATMDNDEADKVKSFRGVYWYFYGKCVPHRSVLSHSLLLGTPIRFMIGYGLPIFLFVAIWNWGTLTLQVDLMDKIMIVNLPSPIISFLAYWYGAAILADICHMVLDKYNPIQWIFGKR